MRIGNLGQLNWRVGESKNGDLKGKTHEGKRKQRCIQGESQGQ